MRYEFCALCETCVTGQPRRQHKEFALCRPCYVVVAYIDSQEAARSDLYRRTYSRRLPGERR